MPSEKRVQAGLATVAVLLTVLVSAYVGMRVMGGASPVRTHPPHGASTSGAGAYTTDTAAGLGADSTRHGVAAGAKLASALQRAELAEQALRELKAQTASLRAAAGSAGPASAPTAGLVGRQGASGRGPPSGAADLPSDRTLGRNHDELAATQQHAELDTNRSLCYILEC